MASHHTKRFDALVLLMLAYCAASLLHFVHNAVFIKDYPNLPAWLSSAEVYGAWLAITSVGLAGYILMQLGLPRAGLLAIAVYAAFGFDGLEHYTRAPFSAHTTAMNLTIGFEVLAAAVLLIAVVMRFAEQVSFKSRRIGASGG